MDISNLALNDEQKETVGMLASQIDNLQIVPCETDTNVFVFEGDGVDGPAIGYLEIDGKVSWIAGG